MRRSCVWPNGSSSAPRRPREFRQHAEHGPQPPAERHLARLPAVLRPRQHRRRQWNSRKSCPPCLRTAPPAPRGSAVGCTGARPRIRPCTASSFRTCSRDGARDRSVVASRAASASRSAAITLDIRSRRRIPRAPFASRDQRARAVERVRFRRAASARVSRSASSACDVRGGQPAERERHLVRRTATLFSSIARISAARRTGTRPRCQA